MTSFEPVQAGPYLTPSDPPDLANITKAIVDWAALRSNMRFASTAARDAAIPAPVEGMECVTGTGAAMIKWLYVSAAWLDIRRTGIAMGTPTATGAVGTSTVAATETRDAVLGDYVFTAVAGRRYQAVMTGLHIVATVAADIFGLRIRNGGASTPTAASTLVASTRIHTTVAGAMYPVPLSRTFVPGAGTVTLSVFAVRTAGTGTAVMTDPDQPRELYVVDLGPA